MSVKNFSPKVWSSRIDQSLDEFLVAAEGCNTEYEGEIKEAGDQIRVQQAIRPTILEDHEGKPIDMSTPEDPDGTTLAMDIIHQAAFNYSIPNIDEAQAKGNLGSALKQEVTQGMANAIDKRILVLAGEKGVLAKSASTQITKDNILNFVNKGMQALYEKNVPANSELELLISPAFHTVFLEAYAKLNTNNPEVLKRGTVGFYGNATVKLTNNLFNDNTDDFCIIRTKKAFAFAKPLIKTEALKNPSRMGDTIRGTTLYGCKVMRPAEAYVLRAHI